MRTKNLKLKYGEIKKLQIFEMVYTDRSHSAVLRCVPSFGITRASPDHILRANTEKTDNHKRGEFSLKYDEFTQRTEHSDSPKRTMIILMLMITVFKMMCHHGFSFSFPQFYDDFLTYPVTSY